MVNMSTKKAPKPDHEAIIALERERLSTLINSMADAVIAVDEHQKIAIYNGAALSILDVNKALTGKRIHTLMHLINKNNQPIDIEELIERSKTPFSSRDMRLEYPNNDTINLYLSIAPVHLGYGTGGQRGHVLLIRDITREKSLEEERNEFISVVSHELRTPIAIAEGNIGNAQFMAEKSSEIPLDVKKSLDAAHEQVVFLGGMINDLATLSRAERGKLVAEIEPINVTEVLSTIEKDYQPQATKKGLNLTVKLDPHLELLKSSKLYVEEILQNFVTNAIKYTDTGGITIMSHHKKDGVLIEIIDTGIGISKADQQKVFDKFFRSEDFRTRQSNGTGLGLYVTVKLAHLVNAEIDVKSELNKGSVFSVYFPNLQ
ncbi:MAG: domain S-box protein [Patescibacteria group bacterium]|nr:domain S-box protein [Patescibacteria group bacterium]